jgi:hypothetical protein
MPRQPQPLRLSPGQPVDSNLPHPRVASRASAAHRATESLDQLTAWPTHRIRWAASVELAARSHRPA